MIGFSFCGVLFLLTGIGIQYRLKKYFPAFYRKYKCMVWVAILALFISMFLRTILDFIAQNKEIAKIIDANVQWWNATQVILCDWVPCMLQFFSLVFGYIRRRSNMKL